MQRITLLALGLAVAGMSATPVGAQTLAAAATMEARPPAAELRDAYTVQLVSEWPEYAGDTPECTNRATETVSGTLQRVAGGYTGTLTRRTNLTFCGTHGGDAVRRCTLELVGEGPVEAVGVLMPEGERTALRLRWRPVDGEGSVLTDGDCDPVFASKLRAMYRTIVRQVEFGLPEGRGTTRVQRLPDQGWVLRIE